MEYILKKHLLVVTLLAAALAGCSDNRYPQPVYQQPVAAAPVVYQQPVAPAPVIIQQAAPAHSDGLLTGALVGGAVGYMAGRSNTPSAPSANTTTINKTVIVKQYAAPVAAPVAVPPMQRSVPVMTPVVRPAPVMQRSVSVTPTPTRMSLSKPAPSTPKSIGGFSRRR